MTGRPNILLVITDHQAYYRHHRPGEFEYVWPRFERFCSEGVRFERAYSVCPLCTPARASMMTGLYPSRHGLIRNSEEGGMADFVPAQQLYSHVLAGRGYRNAYVGKWHCGREMLPQDYGMEGWSLPEYGKIYMSDAYRAYAAEQGLGDARALVEHSMDRPEHVGDVVTLHHDSPWHFMNGSGVLQGPPEAHEEQFVALLAAEKLRELAAGDQPWSLVASFWGPHHAYYPTEPYASMVDPASIPEYPSFRDDLSGKPEQYRRHLACKSGRMLGADWAQWQPVMARAYGQGLQTDAAVGTVLDALEASGAASNTLVIWCADHGDALASHGGMWDKWSTFAEELVRIPLAVRWPTRFRGGASLQSLVSNMDVTATLLDAAGVPVPSDWDSRSLLPLCDDPDGTDWPEALVSEINPRDDTQTLARMVVTDRFKYVADVKDGEELYDLVCDPYEMTNLLGSPEVSGKEQEFRTRLGQHISRRADRLAFALAARLTEGCS